MRVALEVAASAFATGDVPVGAAVLDSAGRVLATAANRREADGDPTAHAEVLALRAAAAQHGDGAAAPDAAVGHLTGEGIDAPPARHDGDDVGVGEQAQRARPATGPAQARHERRPSRHRLVGLDVDAGLLDVLRGRRNDREEREQQRPQPA